MKGPYYVFVNDAQGFFIKVDISLLFTNLGIVVIMHQKVLLFHVRKEGKHGIRYLDVPLFEITYHHLLKGRKWGGGGGGYEVLTLFHLSFFLSMKLFKGFLPLYGSICLSINML